MWIMSEDYTIFFLKENDVLYVERIKHAKKDAWCIYIGRYPPSGKSVQIPYNRYETEEEAKDAMIKLKIKIGAL